MAFWLMKNEVTSYHIGDFARDGRTCWEGVRNYQARNFMRDQMQVGDLAFFYHSNASPSGVAGVMRISRAAYPDDTQFDAASKYFEPRATPDAPVWCMVDVELVEQFPRIVSIAELRETPGLEDLMLLRQGSRLSIAPVAPEHFEMIRAMGV